VKDIDVLETVASLSHLLRLYLSLKKTN
jgi:hypothetical protein